MEALLSQFTLLSNHCLTDKNSDPSAIEDLMKLFEIESYRAWAAMELDQQTELHDAETAIRDADEYLDSVMESALYDMRCFEEELEREAMRELDDLIKVSDRARNMGNMMEKAAGFAAKKYVEAALGSAGASMRNAVKAAVAAAAGSKKVHPS